MIIMNGQRVTTTVRKTKEGASITMFDGVGSRVIKIAQVNVGKVVGKLAQVVMLTPQADMNELVESIEPLLIAITAGLSDQEIDVLLCGV